VRVVHAPNFLHDEGADYILRRMFPVGGGFAPARSDWKLCIGGVNCLGPYTTPNGTLGAADSLSTRDDVRGDRQRVRQ
jgi:hypothetical protein